MTTLYFTSGSAPCYQVILTAKALNVDLELKNLDFQAKQHLEPNFLKLNPQHTVPTLVDGQFSLWESRAISRYLVNQYGADSSLYPKEPKARALVDQRLDFDLATLYQRFGNYFYPIYKGQEADPSKLVSLQEALGFLNTFLEDSKYVAGNEITIADFAILSSITVFDICGIDLKPHDNIQRWFELMKNSTAGYKEFVLEDIKIYAHVAEEIKNKTNKQS